METSGVVDLKDILLKYGLSDEGTLDRIIEEYRTSGSDLREAVIKEGVVTEDALLFAIGTEMNIPFVNITPESIDRSLIMDIPREVLEEKRFIPLIELDDEITVAVAEPDNEELMGLLQDTYPGRKVNIALSVASNILETIESLFSESEEETTSLTSPAISLYYTTLLDAVKARASAIYIESTDEKMRLRVKKDKRVVNRGEFPAEYIKPITDKVCESIGMDSTGRGSLRTRIGRSEVFLSARLIGPEDGRGVIILLRYPGRLPSLKDLPLEDEYLNLLKAELHNTTGLIVITGFNENFMTDTVLALLRELKPERRKIVGILRDDLPLKHLERYIHQSIEETNRSIANLVGTGPDGVFIQDAEREGLDVRYMLDLSSETLLIVTFHGNGDALFRHLKEKNGSIPENLLLIETDILSVLCPYCSMMNWERGAGCRRCGYSGVSRQIRKMDITKHTEGGNK